MKIILKAGIICLLLLNGLYTMAQNRENQIRVEPPNWWIGMKDSNVQLMIYGENIAGWSVKVESKTVDVVKIETTENTNYLFVTLNIGPETKPGNIKIAFFDQQKKVHSLVYELKEKNTETDRYQGFSPADVIYLLLPDRFADGDSTNNNLDEMLEKTDRKNPDGRHGGDLKGIQDHLDYFVDLGVTALWMNPVLENNMPDKSYHGYATTDFYKVDARLGSNEEYKDLIKRAHEKGLKVIKDMIFNHCGSEHWWMKDLPSEDWVHQFPEYTQSNFRATTIMDPYASEHDKEKMKKGWFDKSMPDLNQGNPFLANYLIQNTIWWIEYAGLDGIRMDTYPYPDDKMMGKWVDRILKEYPTFSIVGETWMQKEALTAYWKGGANNPNGYDSGLPSVTDFPLCYAISDALIQEDTWTEGLNRLYYVFVHDYLYNKPETNVIFLDNHDLDRFYTKIGEDVEKYKMALAILLTTRGIPVIYYGTEILMTGLEHDGHGEIRKEFPGGFKYHRKNVFKQKGLTEEEAIALDYSKKLLNWRKNEELVQKGKLKHFLPENNVYVYFRYTNSEAVMVVVNKNKAEQLYNLELERFIEILDKYNSAVNVLSGEKLVLEKRLKIPYGTNIFKLN